MWYLFVFTLMIYSSHSWVLKSSHKQIIVGITKNVSLECRYDNQDNGKTQIIEVLAMIIQKYKGIDQWETYVKIRDNHENVVFGDGISPGVSARGYVNMSHNSFLSISWSEASSTISGQYACEINGLAKDDALIDVVTTPVSINESVLPLEYGNLLSKILEVKEQADKRDEQYKQTLSRMQALVQTVIDEVDTLKTGVNVTQLMMKKEINEEINSKISYWHGPGHWPGGEFALLSTDYRCPSSANTVWKAGYIKFNSESSSGSHNNNSVSVPSHLAKPIFAKEATLNVVYIRTCKIETSSTDLLWPKGSYCIHRVGGSCPGGFQGGAVRLDDEDSTKLGTIGYNAPDVFENGAVTDIIFCCRDDERPTTPINLPVDRSFYLYRYKGTCQTVFNMYVSEEWLQIDTEHNDNDDAAPTTVYPDFRPNPTKFFLCYYSKLP